MSEEESRGARRRWARRRDPDEPSRARVPRPPHPLATVAKPQKPNTAIDLAVDEALAGADLWPALMGAMRGDGSRSYRFSH